MNATFCPKCHASFALYLPEENERVIACRCGFAFTAIEGLGGNNPAVKKEVGGTHYSRCAVQPFDLQKAMESSGNAFVDGARCMVIKYAFRKKGDAKKMAEDLRKAAHYCEEAAQHLEDNAK